MKKPLFFISSVFLILFSSLVFSADNDNSPADKEPPAPEAEWLSTETEHFRYNFTDAKTAETILIHAETYYEWIKKLFEIGEDNRSDKAPIYIFDDKDKWKQFSAKASPILEGTAFTTGKELYIYRDPYWLSPMKTIAHELTHVIVFRFLDGPIPLFLNEGFAEYVSIKAVATQFGGDEYQVRTVRLLDPDKYIPLKELLAMQSYPDGRVDVFYQESELLVRFLVSQKGGQSFYRFLMQISGGAGVEEALNSVYSLGLDELESKFRAAAVSRSAV